MKIPGYESYSFVDGEVVSTNTGRKLRVEYGQRIKLRKRGTDGGTLFYIDEIALMCSDTDPREEEGCVAAGIEGMWILNDGRAFRETEEGIVAVRRVRDDKYAVECDGYKVFASQQEIRELTLEELKLKRRVFKSSRYTYLELLEKGKSDKEIIKILKDKKEERGKPKKKVAKPRKVKVDKTEATKIKGFASYKLNGETIISYLGTKPRELPKKEVYVLMSNIGERVKLTLEQIKEKATI